MRRSWQDSKSAKKPWRIYLEARDAEPPFDPVNGENGNQCADAEEVPFDQGGLERVHDIDMFEGHGAVRRSKRLSN